MDPKPPAPPKGKAKKLDVNWNVGCENCGNKPTVGNSKLCGPCFFGEADTADGNW